MKREKNYDFNFEDLHRNEQGRILISEKLEKNDDGFTPKTFSSSRSIQKRVHTSEEEGIFSYQLSSIIEVPEKNNMSSLEMNLKNSSSKIIMHKSVRFFLI